METAYSFFMFCFALLLLLYAVAVALSKSTDLIPRMDRVQVKNPKRYAWQFAKTTAIVALAPAVSALVGLLLGPGPGVIALFPAMAVCIWLGVRYSSKELDDRPNDPDDE
jgi:energy-converting hydrogenase Eha subunit A